MGVIGPNGVGKSTLFKTIVGLEPLDGGELKIGETVKISYVDQSRANIDPEKSLWEVVSDGLDYIKVGQVEMPSRAYVSAFGFKGPDQQKKAGVLSGGQRNRLNLALTLKQGGNVVGRGQDADFRLPDTGVSRRHLEISWDGQSATLADIGSTNGTTVNGTPVQTWQLADGDVIRVGHSSLTFRTQG